MKRIEIYHGSDRVVRRPLPNSHRNEFAEGFYCTHDRSLAGGWACSDGKDGIINTYSLELFDLQILCLDPEPRAVLQWLRFLLANRTIRPRTPAMAAGIEWLKETFSADLFGIDIVVGPAADDSRFSLATAFLANRISIQQLCRGLSLFDPWDQIVLVGEDSFKFLSYKGSETAEAERYRAPFMDRDRKAREKFLETSAEHALEETYILDLVREGVRADDPRLFRCLSRRCHNQSGGGCGIRRPRLRDRCRPLHVVLRRQRIRRTLR